MEDLLHERVSHTRHILFSKQSKIIPNQSKHLVLLINPLCKTLKFQIYLDLGEYSSDKLHSEYETIWEAVLNFNNI